MKTRTGVAVLVAVPLALGLAACGSSSTTTSSIAAVALTTTSSSTTTTTPPSKKKSAPAKPKKKKSPAHAQTTTTTTTSSTTTTTSSTTTTTTTTHPTTTTHRTTTTTPALAPLPSPYVSGSSGRVHAELHGENHTPLIGVKWEYQVEATNAQGQPLTGKVLVQFLLGGTVVGHQSPPTEPLKNGKLIYKNTFPAPSKGIALTFEVVVMTPEGNVTLNWPVKSHT